VPQQADRILDAAAQLFGTQPFHEVLMDDVAAKADVGKGTVYRYFRDKEDLYLAILKRASVQFLERMRQKAEGPGEPRERLEAMVVDLIAYFDEQPHLLELILRAELLRRPGTEFPWQRTRDELGALVRGILAEGRARGQLAVDDADLAVLMLLGGLRAVIRFGARPRPADLAGRVVDGLLDGYDTRSPLS
jgi:AcrR family transcriptional regulator